MINDNDTSNNNEKKCGCKNISLGYSVSHAVEHQMEMSRKQLESWVYSLEVINDVELFILAEKGT